MRLPRSIAGWAGVAFTLASPFINWEPILGGLPAPGIMFQFAVASALASIAFGVNKRTLKFFHVRGIGWRDIGAALLAFVAAGVVVALAEPLINRFGGSAPPDTASDSLREYPLWFALVTAATAGVFEEFIYRGFMIEELGELIRSRRTAAVIAVVSFGLAHYVNNGWSVEMIYPGLVGVVITALYFQRRNLTICILLHATIDSLHALTR